MINPFLAGLAQAGADATQNIAASMAKSQELQRQQKEKDDEKTATIAKFYLDNGMVTAAAPHLKKLYGDQFDDKHLATLQAEADQKKKIANLDQLKTISDFTGHDAAKSQSLADSLGITVPTQQVTSTAQVPVVKDTSEGRQYSPIKADGSPIHAPLTTTKTASLFDLMAKPKGDYELVKSADGAILRVDNATGKYETLKQGTAKTPAAPRLVWQTQPDGSKKLVPEKAGLVSAREPRSTAGEKPRYGWINNGDGTKTWGVLAAGVTSHGADKKVDVLAVQQKVADILSKEFVNDPLGTSPAYKARKAELLRLGGITPSGSGGGGTGAKSLQARKDLSSKTSKKTVPAKPVKKTADDMKKKWF